MRVDRRLAPATDIAMANAAMTNAESSRNVPSEAMGRKSLSVTGCRSRMRVECQPPPAVRPALARSGGGTARSSAGFVFGRALGHDAVILHVEAVRGQRALEHDLRLVLERIGDDAGVARGHDVSLVLDLELPVQRVGPAHDRAGHDEAVELEPLAMPRFRVRHDLINVLVILSALAEGRVQEPAKRQDEDETRHPELHGFLTHR